MSAEAKSLNEDVTTMKLETIALWLYSLEQGKFTEQDWVTSRVACGYIMALVSQIHAANPRLPIGSLFNRVSETGKMEL